MENESGAQLPSGTYGFIGLGNMGYGMAMNVRKKMPSSSTLVVCELDQARREEFCTEAKQYGQVETAETPKEVSGRCVHCLFHPFLLGINTDLETGDNHNLASAWPGSLQSLHRSQHWSTNSLKIL